MTLPGWRVFVGLACALVGLAPAGAHAQTLAPPPAPDSVRVSRGVPFRALAPGVEQRRVVSRQALFAGNVVAGGVLTTGRALAEGVPAQRLPGAALGGALAGAGFYAAKAVVGEGRPVEGFALAYAAASLAENVAEGGHVLSHVRLGLGPVDVRVATPFARGETPGVGIEIEPLSVAAAVVLPLQGFRLGPCRAGLCYRSDEPMLIERDGRQYRRLGRAAGRVVRLWPPHNARTEAHEGVHVVQGMQVAAATPRASLRSLIGAETDAAVAADLRLDWLTALAGVGLSQVPYPRQWTEREAFTLSR